ncbi:phosphotransferase family protein [Deinococcus sp. QL22]|uniref:phosphotransferase family protein n=1 Tax=Deinococcus sp. QL22 TaxID=2939437 RepID=UPI002016B16E|nr:phosphotransferase [Deinococcus sp. QL22]UQN08021.1 aminoglycoside phosphotransferase family protein [Deinococcus sp. QL22]
MLTESTVIPYLLRCGLIQHAAIVDGDVMVVNASRRNRNFQVISRYGPSFFLKQGLRQDDIVSPSREAQVYRAFENLSNFEALHAHLPRMHAFDPDEDLLIVELLAHTENLREYHRRTGRFSTSLAASLGDVLGILHGSSDRSLQSLTGLVAPEPAAFYLYRPGLALLRDFSHACIDLIQMIQHSPEVCRFLDEVRQDWRAEAPIHHDVRWDNILVAAGSSQKGARSGKRQITLVDWESSGLGDPCWDVGTVFGDYLSFWLSSVPVAGNGPPDRYLSLARYPLEKIQPAIRAFWHAYIRRLKLTPEKAEEWLVRSSKYAALKLIQTGLEQVQRASQWTLTSVCHLQLGMNVSQRPREGSVALMGLSHLVGGTR